VIPPFLWFRARLEPPRAGVLDQATLALVPLNLDGYPTPQDPVQRLVSIDVKSGVEKQLATLDPPPDSILAGRISLHPDGNRLAVSFVRPHGKIYMLEGFDESTSGFARLMRRFKRAGTAVVRAVGKQEAIHMSVKSPCRTCALCGCSRMTRNRKLSGQGSPTGLNFPFADHPGPNRLRAKPVSNSAAPPASEYELQRQLRRAG
jgi:hypothetical protein